MTFSCRVCPRPNLTIKDMKPEKFLLHNGRGICAPCNREYEKVRLSLRKAEKDPDNFLTCDDCDRIFKKHKSGGPDKYGQQKLRTNCPCCGSDNIAKY